jgi:hypothetical protein
MNSFGQYQNIFKINELSVECIVTDDALHIYAPKRGHSNIHE